MLKVGIIIVLSLLAVAASAAPKQFLSGSCGYNETARRGPGHYTEYRCEGLRMKKHEIFVRPREQLCLCDSGYVKDLDDVCRSARDTICAGCHCDFELNSVSGTKMEFESDGLSEKPAKGPSLYCGWICNEDDTLTVTCEEVPWSLSRWPCTTGFVFDQRTKSCGLHEESRCFNATQKRSIRQIDSECHPDNEVALSDITPPACENRCSEDGSVGRFCSEDPYEFAGGCVCGEDYYRDELTGQCVTLEESTCNKEVEPSSSICLGCHMHEVVGPAQVTELVCGRPPLVTSVREDETYCACDEGYKRKFIYANQLSRCVRPSQCD